MEHLWSPWRAKHIDRITEGPTEEEMQDERSLFERLAAEEEDERNLIVWRGRLVFVIMNLYPYNNGHLMIVPYRREGDFAALTLEEQHEISETIARCTRWLRRALNPDGFNVGMNLGAAAGAGIPDHVHVHVVPRWSGDTNFMPSIANTKVLPEAIGDTYRKIRAAID
ncbi:MAG: HIT family protein [Rhodothermales bacterium]